MSKIIRSVAAKQDENRRVKIAIRDLLVNSMEDNAEDADQFSYIEAKQQLLRERDALLGEANKEIESKKEQFETYKQEQLAAIENAKQMWEEEKVTLSQQAYEEGFQQGYEEGLAKAQADMEMSIKIANKTIDNAKVNAEKYVADQEKVILDLAMKSAERIIGAALDENNELFVSIVKRALKEAREMKEIKIYVSPKYHQLVTENRDELVELFPNDVPFLIFVNEDLENEQCYIETNHGRIVVSIDDQLQELRNQLIELLTSKE